jgi:hypothetical protein
MYSIQAIEVLTKQIHQNVVEILEHRPGGEHATVGVTIC